MFLVGVLPYWLDTFFGGEHASIAPLGPPWVSLLSAASQTSVMTRFHISLAWTNWTRLDMHMATLSTDIVPHPKMYVPNPAFVFHYIGASVAFL